MEKTANGKNGTRKNGPREKWPPEKWSPGKMFLKNFSSSKEYWERV